KPSAGSLRATTSIPSCVVVRVERQTMSKNESIASSNRVIMPTATIEPFLAHIPVLDDLVLAEAWAYNQATSIVSTYFGEVLRNKSRSVIAPHVPILPDPVSKFYVSPVWWRFALAVLIADWACYTKEVDRVDCKRLFSAVTAFPSGFRLLIAPQ